MDESDRAAMELADEMSRRIAAEAQARFDDLWRSVQDGVPIDEALAQYQRSLPQGIGTIIAEAFNALLKSAPGLDAVMAMPIGKMSLSSKLYAGSEELSEQVRAVVEDHTRGMHQAQALSRALYDGYTPNGGALEGRVNQRGLVAEPLASLLKERIPASDGRITTLGAELQLALDRATEAAGRIKSPPLRAAWDEAIAAWEAGTAEARLKQALEVVAVEKARYYADRIARTELARAHAISKSRAIIEGGDEVVQVVLNPLHPLMDVCDMHAGGDFWGLGPGLYPASKAPRPPYHPHCWCTIRTRPSLSAAGAEYREGEAARYLGSVGGAKAWRIAGSQAKADRITSGERWLSVIDEAKPTEYHTRTVGDAVKDKLPGE